MGRLLNLASETLEFLQESGVCIQKLLGSNTDAPMHPAHSLIYFLSFPAPMT